ncbi:MAG: asparagine synthase (glutamine-hydrolyzing) [Chitinophagaceae bacterium]|nr:asparagine synthase (glutamine-hydrolyzing) [Chitinophagaceae bacterium]
MKSIITLPIKREVNREAVTNFLYLGYVPGEDTIYKDCHKLPPGQYAVLDNGRLDIFSYWSLEDEIDPAVFSDEKEAKKKLKSLLFSSVEYCMISDVPLGVFLSGGVDSSTVAAIARNVTGTPVQTFSIGFNEEKYNETAFASQVAKHIGSNHHEFTVTEQDALQLVDSLTSIYDEPYADTSAIPTLMVSQLARKHVTVALSGDGGDELFMGYGFYYWAKKLDNPFLKAFRRPIAKGLFMLGNSRMKRGSKLFDYPGTERKKSHIFSQEQYLFTEKEISEMLVEPAGITLDETLENPKRELSIMEAQSFFDIKNYLPEELLVKTDRASMHHSLEVRVPFLDHRLIEFAINLDESLKVRGKVTKYLLREVLYDLVPKKILDRPKWGFAVPMNLWMKNELNYLLDKFLSEQIIREVNLVRYEYVKELLRLFKAGNDYLYNRIWALVLLHKWYKEKMP